MQNIKEKYIDTHEIWRNLNRDFYLLYYGHPNKKIKGLLLPLSLKPFPILDDLVKILIKERINSL